MCHRRRRRRRRRRRTIGVLSFARFVKLPTVVQQWREVITDSSQQVSSKRSLAHYHQLVIISEMIWPIVSASKARKKKTKQLAPRKSIFQLLCLCLSFHLIHTVHNQTRLSLGLLSSYRNHFIYEKWALDTNNMVRRTLRTGLSSRSHDKKKLLTCESSPNH